jgi:hypothetical protein
MAAFLTVHGEDKVRIDRVAVGYDATPAGLSAQLEFSRTQSYENLKKSHPDSWFVASI